MSEAIPPIEVEKLEVEVDGAEVSGLALHSFELHEKICEPYSLMLVLSTADGGLDVAGLLGGRCLLQLARGDFERVVQGVVLKADTIGTIRQRLRFRLWVVPAFELLGLSKRRRIFQGLTAVQIVETMLADVPEGYGGSIDTSALADASLRVRDYGVQWDETDLEFARRLLAEEGIAFSFRHGGATEALVLMPMTAILHSAAGETEVGPRPIKLRPGNPDTASEEVVRQLQTAGRMRPAQTEVSMRDWKAQPPVTVSARRDPFDEDAELPDSLGRFGEHYEHELYRAVEPTGGGALFEQVENEAIMAAHRHRLDDVRASGTGNVLGFTDGATFELSDHPTHDVNGLFALLSVTHRGEFAEGGVDPEGHQASYSNHFTCFRFKHDDGRHTFAPPRRPKPRALGPQTATVIGPPSEEIHTDEHGRIQVRMHWDRDEHEASCFARVGQIWAGAGFGATFLPRVGMEVVISFIDGDPDQPLCTGVVYNGQNQPPYPLPGRQDAHGATHIQHAGRRRLQRALVRGRGGIRGDLRARAAKPA